MSLLEARSVSVTLGHRQALTGVDICCRPGEVTAVLGPNGAGKSTLLACLAGLRQPDTGAVLLGGAPLREVPPLVRARRVGLLPQAGEVHWDVTVRSLVELGRLPHRRPMAAPGAGDHAAVDRALAATDLQAFADRQVFGLSGGERARALLARVLAGEPDWLLADEPLANLDPAHQLAVLDLFRACAAAGHGVVLVLHDLGQALRVADHVLLLRAGGVVAQGAAADVLTSETLAAVYGVHAYIGASPTGEPVLVPLRRLA